MAITPKRKSVRLRFASAGGSAHGWIASAELVVAARVKKTTIFHVRALDAAGRGESSVLIILLRDLPSD